MVTKSQAKKAIKKAIKKLVAYFIMYSVIGVAMFWWGWYGLQVATTLK